jgi:hypothetical protein
LGFGVRRLETSRKGEPVSSRRFMAARGGILEGSRAGGEGFHGFRDGSERSGDYCGGSSWGLGDLSGKLLWTPNGRISK